VGDLFQVLPQATEAVKAAKGWVAPRLLPVRGVTRPESGRV